MSEKNKIFEVFPADILQSGSTSNTYVLVMFEPNSKTSIPILVGEHEAQAIILAKENIQMRRPLTHQLLCNICSNFSLEILNVVIDKFSEGIFFTTITISDGIGEPRMIDSRTSDAIAIALTLKVPIYITAEVLDETGIKYNDTDNDASAETEQLSLEELEEQLQQLLDDEEYEKAAEIQAKIDELKKQ